MDARRGAERTKLAAITLQLSRFFYLFLWKFDKKISVRLQ